MRSGDHGVTSAGPSAQTRGGRFPWTELAQHGGGGRCGFPRGDVSVAQSDKKWGYVLFYSF